MRVKRFKGSPLFRGLPEPKLERSFYTIFGGEVKKTVLQFIGKSDSKLASAAEYGMNRINK